MFMFKKFATTLFIYGSLAQFVLADRDMEGSIKYMKSSYSQMQTAGRAAVPMGFVMFCIENKPLCLPDRRSMRDDSPVKLNDKTLSQLKSVQREVNSAIRPMSDLRNKGREDHWSYAENGYGDCEDYSLIKQKLLLAQGWSKRSLLLTTAITEAGEHHVVLVARTNKGDYVLDNRSDAIVKWDKLPYQWLAQQSSQRPLKWQKVI